MPAMLHESWFYEKFLIGSMRKTFQVNRTEDWAGMQVIEGYDQGRVYTGQKVYGRVPSHKQQQ